MTNHLSDEEMLKSILQLLNDQEEEQVQVHLAECESCRLKYRQIRTETEFIAGYDPIQATEVPPLPKIRSLSIAPLMKIAAILIAGFLAGYLTSDYTRHQTPEIVEQQMAVNTPQMISAAFATCPQVDTRVISH
jgi:hypothetical protein